MAIRERELGGAAKIFTGGFVIWLFPMESNIGLLDANNKLYERVEWIIRVGMTRRIVISPNQSFWSQYYKTLQIFLFKEKEKS